VNITKRFNRLVLASRVRPLQRQEAFAALYDRAHLLVYRYVYGLMGGPVEDVEDLTAETFMRAWKTRDRFEGDDGAAIGWLLKIARHLVVDAYRRRTLRGEPVPLDGVNAESQLQGPEDRLLADEQLRQLVTALDALPIEQRDMLVLRYILGWRVNRVAEHLGLAENTVSVTMRRALSRLRRAWPEA